MKSRVDLVVFLDNIITPNGTQSLPVQGGGVIAVGGEGSAGYPSARETNSNIGTSAVNTNLPLLNSSMMAKQAPTTLPIGPSGLPNIVPKPYPKDQFQYNVNGGYYLDLFPDTTIPITYQVTDLTDISSVNSSYTLTFKLPYSKINEFVFGNVAELSSSSTFNANLKARCYVLVDTISVLEGYIQLKNVSQNRLTGVAELECVIYADNDNLWKNIGDRLLTDLVFSEMDHTRSILNVTQSWTGNSDTLGYYYPLIDYGGQGANTYVLSPQSPAYGDWTLVDIGGYTASTGGGIGNSPPQVQKFLATENMYPAVYVKTIVDKIFQQAGYQYNSSFLTSSTFKNLLIPFARAELKRSASFDVTQEFQVGIGYVPTGGVGFNQYGTWSMVMSATVSPVGVVYPGGRVTGIGNLTTTGGVFGHTVNYDYDGIRIRMTDDGGNYGGSYNWPWNVNSYDPGNVWDPVSFAYNNKLTATSAAGWSYPLRQRFGVYYDIQENNVQGGVDLFNGDSKLYLRRSRDWQGNTFSWFTSMKNAGVAGTKAYYNYTGYTNTIGWSPEGAIPINSSQNGVVLDPFAVTYSTTTYKGATVEVRRYKGLITYDWLNDSTATASNIHYPIWPGEEVWLEYCPIYGRQFAGFTASVVGVATNIFNQMYPDTGGSLNADEPIDMNQVLPLNIKQKDFLMSIINMFNLVMEPSKANFFPNILNIQTRDNYYDAGVVKDWSGKVNYNETYNLQILGESQNRSFSFKYKDDSDFYNQSYRNKYVESYGSYKYINDNDFVTGNKKIEMIFSPTPLVNIINSKGFIIPKIHKVSGDRFVKGESNMRIVQRTDAGVLQNTYGEYWRLGKTGTTVFAPVNYKFGYYPYVGHFDNPFTPTFDLNFGQTSELFYPSNETITNQNLFNKYWYRQMNEYSHKDSRIVTYNMYLKPQDIYDFKFNDKIFIDGQYFKVMKIEGYDACNPEAGCKVILIKTLDVTIPAIYSKPNGLVNVQNTGSLTSLGNQTNNLYSSGVGAIGLNNTVGDNSAGSFVAGSYNTLGSNLVQFVSGDGNTVATGAVNTNVFGSNNTIAPETNATVFGNNNTVGTYSFVSINGDNNTVGTWSYVSIVGDDNVVHDSYNPSNTISTISGRNNTIGTNSIATISGDNNTVVESSSISNHIIQVVGSNNTVHPNTLEEATITNVLGSDNLIYPSSTASLSSIFGSNNIVGTNSTTYVVGSNNVVDSGLSYSVVIGDLNSVKSSNVNVFGSSNTIENNPGSAIFGSRNVFDINVTDSVAIGNDINATESGKVYISDVVFTGNATGSAVALASVLTVSSDTGAIPLSNELNVQNIAFNNTTPSSSFKITGGPTPRNYSKVVQPCFDTTDASDKVIVLEAIQPDEICTVEATIMAIDTTGGYCYTNKAYGAFEVYLGAGQFVGEPDFNIKTRAGTSPYVNFIMDGSTPWNVKLLIQGLTSSSMRWFCDIKVTKMNKN